MTLLKEVFLLQPPAAHPTCRQPGRRHCTELLGIESILYRSRPCLAPTVASGNHNPLSSRKCVFWNPSNASSQATGDPAAFFSPVLCGVAQWCVMLSCAVACCVVPGMLRRVECVTCLGVLCPCGCCIQCSIVLCRAMLWGELRRTETCVSNMLCEGAPRCQEVSCYVC